MTSRPLVQRAQAVQCLEMRGIVPEQGPAGFLGGVVLAADVLGDENDPAVLLVPDIGQDRTAWREVADALVLSGRRVVNLDLREDAELPPHIEDLRAVLAQMASRPVVVAAGHGGWAATRALAMDGAHLAAGLVVVDMPVDDDALPEMAATFLATTPLEDLPHLAEHIEQHVHPTDGIREFEFGLDLILESLERLLPAGADGEVTPARAPGTG